MIWEMIERMATDRLWIYTALAGSLFGAAFLFWFKDTRMATWAVSKFDATLEYLAIRWGWTWFQNDPEMILRVLSWEPLSLCIFKCSSILSDFRRCNGT